MPSRKRKSDQDEIAQTLRAARAFVGDNEAATDEEAKVAAELRATLPRPTADEIAALARKLAQSKR